MAEDEARDGHDVAGLLRKNAELLGELKKLKARLAEIEGERDAARAEAEGAAATMRRVQIDEPVEAALGAAFAVPWRVARPLVEEHFDFAIDDHGKASVTAKGSGEAVALDALLSEIAAIPDLAAVMRPASGGGARGNHGDRPDAPSETRPQRVASPFGLR